MSSPACAHQDMLLNSSRNAPRSSEGGEAVSESTTVPAASAWTSDAVTAAILQSSLDCIISMDATGRVLEFNPAAERTFGYRRADVIGRDLASLIIPPELREAHHRGLAHLLATGEGPVLNNRVELPALRADGSRFPVELTVTRLPVAGLPVFTAYVRDITDRRRAAQAQAEHTRLMSLRADVSTALASGDDLQPALQRCAHALVQHLDAAFARIWLLDHTGDTLVLYASAGQYTHLDGPHSRIAMGEFKIGRIAAHRRPHLTNDVQHDPNISDSDWARREGMVAFAGYPLIVNDRAVGVIALFARRPLSDAVLRDLAPLADGIAGHVDRRRAEAALRESEARVRLATDAAELGIWIWHIADDRVSWENDRLYDIFALPRDAPPINAAAFQKDFAHPDDAPAFAQAIARTLDTGERFHFLGRARRGDGVTRWVEFTGRLEHNPHGQPLRMVGTAADVTDRHLAQIRLRESETRYRTLFNSIDEGFCVIDLIFDEKRRAVDYRYLEVNPAFERHTGCRDAVGRRVSEFIPNLESAWLEIFGRVALTGEPTRFVNRVQGLDNRWFDVYAFRVDEGHHKIALIFTDVTRQRDAQDTLQRTLDELEHRVQQRTLELRHRNQQLSRLTSELIIAEHRERRRIAQVLHDHLQQLLVGAKLRLHMLQGKADQRQQTRIQKIDALLDEAVQSSRSLTVELSPPILHQSGLPAAMRWLAGWMLDTHGLTVDLHLDDDADTDREDARLLLFQAVRELLFNVVKHAGVDRASLTLDRDDDGRLRAVVADHGRGFDHEAARASNAANDATGLGLFSIRERLAHLGGETLVDAAPGQGTTFTLLVPIEEG